MPLNWSYLTPIFLLVGSNVFMTTAWYWHLRFKEVAREDGYQERRAESHSHWQDQQ